MHPWRTTEAGLVFLLSTGESSFSRLLALLIQKYSAKHQKIIPPQPVMQVLQWNACNPDHNLVPIEYGLPLSVLSVGPIRLAMKCPIFLNPMPP